MRCMISTIDILVICSHYEVGYALLEDALRERQTRREAGTQSPRAFYRR
jgi:hypothetical protein